MKEYLVESQRRQFIPGSFPANKLSPFSHIRWLAED